MVIYKRGQKKELYDAGKLIFCNKHGEHSNYTYCKSSRYVECNPCRAERQRLYVKNNIFKVLVKWIRRREPCSELTPAFLENLYSLQNKRCALSGLSLTDVSVDRINSSLGYTEENVQLVLFKVNRMKSDLSQEEFIRLCKAIALENN